MGILDGLLGIAAIVLALTARPLGDLPYHWGVYIGATAGIGAITAFSSILSSYGALGATIFVSVSTIACLGILLRKKFGVVALGLLYVLALVRSLQMIFAHTASFGTRSAFAIASAILAVVNAIYLKNRWGLLA
jgi:hypothetical protein